MGTGITRDTFMGAAESKIRMALRETQFVTWRGIYSCKWGTSAQKCDAIVIGLNQEYFDPPTHVLAKIWLDPTGGGVYHELNLGPDVSSPSGRTPFGGRDMMVAVVDEVLKAVCAYKPPKTVEAELDPKAVEYLDSAERLLEKHLGQFSDCLFWRGMQNGRGTILVGMGAGEGGKPEILLLTVSADENHQVTLTSDVGGRPLDSIGAFGGFGALGSVWEASETLVAFFVPKESK